MALASANRAFCPPDKVMPFSPIIVWSPSDSISKSLSKHDSYTALSYWEPLKGLPKVMLFFTVYENIIGYCSTKDTLPYTWRVPE